VRLTHPDRVYYPALGFTKLDLALYYVSIADTVLPHLEGRPLTLVRCPDGVRGETFYQKHPGFWTPPQVRRFPVPGKSEEHLFVDSVAGLVALAQAGILEIHPWNSRVARLEEPDQVIFDLDPDEALPFSRVITAARRVRALLTELGLESFVKTTGGKGLHGTIDIEPGDRLPLMPRHMFKAYADVQVSSKIAVDVDLVAASGVVARGNENAAHQPDATYYLGPGSTPAYGIVNIGARYDLSKWVQLIAQVNNIFDTHYDTAAQLQATGFTSSGNFIARPFPAVSGEFPVQQTTFYAPGSPTTYWIGTRVRF
jgi:DNA ligase D-like protein (predicted polymerase)